MLWEIWLSARDKLSSRTQAIHQRGARTFDEQVGICDCQRRHGASPVAIDSAGMRALYGLAFSFENGDPLRPNLAAGVGLRCMMRLLLGYKGALLWKMQAGMGETVFTPIYKVLKNRGVRFQFFHRVDEPTLSPDRSSIATIRMTRRRSGLPTTNPFVASSSGIAGYGTRLLAACRRGGSTELRIKS